MEQHDRCMTHIRVSKMTRYEYAHAHGTKKVLMHINIFYAQGLRVAGPETDDTVDLLHPLLVGRIPVGAAIGEPKYGERADAPLPKAARR